MASLHQKSSRRFEQSVIVALREAYAGRGEAVAKQRAFSKLVKENKANTTPRKKGMRRRRRRRVFVVKYNKKLKKQRKPKKKITRIPIKYGTKLIIQKGTR